jgi:D-lactate dehydrogenase
MKLFIYCFREFDEKVHFEALKAAYDFTYAATKAYPHLTNAALAEGFEAISATPARLDAELLKRFYALGVRYILSRAIGVDHIDLKAAKELGLRVARVSYEPQTVANYAIMLIMMSLRKMRQILDRAAVQDFTLQGKLGRDISSCTIGVIGTGRIGTTVIRHLQPFGCRILAYDICQNAELSGLCQYAPLETLYQECDVITLHIPSNEASYHLINASAFAQMKPGMVLVNTARGTLIDTEALIAALESGKLAGAALDVLEDENGLYYHNRMGDCIPNRQLAQLRAFPNVILSPHTAFYTNEVVYSMAEKTVKGLFDMAAGNDNPLIVI